MLLNLILKHVQRVLFFIGLLGMVVSFWVTKILWWFPLLTWACLILGALLAYLRKSLSPLRKIADRIAALTRMVTFIKEVNSVSRWEIYVSAVNAFVVFPSMKKAAWLIDAFNQADTNEAIKRNVTGKALLIQIDWLSVLVRKAAVRPVLPDKPR